MFVHNPVAFVKWTVFDKNGDGNSEKQNEYR